MLRWSGGGDIRAGVQGQREDHTRTAGTHLRGGRHTGSSTPEEGSLHVSSCYIYLSQVEKFLPPGTFSAGGWSFLLYSFFRLEITGSSVIRLFCFRSKLWFRGKVREQRLTARLVPHLPFFFSSFCRGPQSPFCLFRGFLSSKKK